MISLKKDDLMVVLTDQFYHKLLDEHCVKVAMKVKMEHLLTIVQVTVALKATKKVMMISMDVELRMMKQPVGCWKAKETLIQ